MYKKVCLILAWILTAIMIAGCANTAAEKDTTDETSEKAADVADTSATSGYLVRQVIRATFDEALEMSDCAVVATYLSCEEKRSCVDYIFSVKETLRGEVEDIIHVRDARGYITAEGTDICYNTGEDIYTEGEDYVLILEKSDSLFYEYPQYQAAADIFIPAGDTGKSTIQGQPLTEVSGMNVTTIKNYIQRARTAYSAPRKNYTTATDLPTIVAESDLALEVKITELDFESEFANSNTYYCDVQQILKGGTIVMSEERGDIIVTLTKDSVEVGGTYVLLLNRVDETSIIYTQSSFGSIIPVSDTETINEIMELINR